MCKIDGLNFGKTLSVRLLKFKNMELRINYLNNQIEESNAIDGEIRLHSVSKSCYCLGDSWGEIGNGKCDKQCEDCKAKVLKQ